MAAHAGLHLGPRGNELGDSPAALLYESSPAAPAPAAAGDGAPSSVVGVSVLTLPLVSVGGGKPGARKLPISELLGGINLKSVAVPDLGKLTRYKPEPAAPTDLRSPAAPPSAFAQRARSPGQCAPQMSSLCYAAVGLTRSLHTSPI